MGNSGSIHNIAADPDDLHPYPHQHGQALLGDHQPLKWAPSHPQQPHNPQQQQQAHVKVLPDLNEGPRLRFTANGAILQSGGTISGRRDSVQQPPVLQRSKTSLHYNLGSRHSAEGFNRFPERTGTLILDRESKELSYKRFGSEPDLRINGDDENSGISTTKISKSKMVKNKKRRTAPPPPRDQRIIEHNLTPNCGNQKKLRLFKTKTESKKASAPIKLVAEASDLHFKRSSLSINNQQIEDHPRRNMQYIPPPESRKLPAKKSNQLNLESSWQESKVKVLSIPPPAFRREKSFDAGLLTSHKQSIIEEIDSIKRPQDRQKLSPGKTVQSPKIEKRLASRQISVELERPLKRFDDDGIGGKKLPTRKYSQPAQLRSGDFKKELEEATKRRSMIVESLDKENDGARLRQVGQSVPVPKAKLVRARGDRPNQAPPVEPKKRIESKIPQLTKTFYFGMEGKKPSGAIRKDPDDFGKVQMDVIDEFAKNIMTNRRHHRAGGYESSESALSSEEGYPMDGVAAGFEENTDGGIHVHVRPTLPRRQLEIPRFSPAAAWRMLNDEQKDAALFGRGTNLFLSDLSVEPKQPLEERIQRIYREPNPPYPDNKSGDSGISGDAGLPERTDSPRQNFIAAGEQDNEQAAKVGPFLKPWIPQQDLDEDTSSDGGDATKIEDTNKLSSRGHVFSLSLPRESHMSTYDEKDKPGFSSLQKLKKTVSNALFNAQDRTTSYRSDNWLLSRSAPNSIENALPGVGGNHQLPGDRDPGGDHQVVAIQPSSFSYFTGGKHVMYLPNHPIGETSDHQNFDRIVNESHGGSRQFYEGDITSGGKIKDRKYSSHNKSGQLNGGKERESLQDIQPIVKDERTISKGNSSKSRVHRFTFQSTVRQIERRRIAEKLSKEAEEKEAQRLSELEAMRKVEEEFQRKRAREKASIRHQLRLFSLEEGQCASLPVDWQLIESQNHRAEPDGAVSSPTPSPTSNEDPITQENEHNHHRKSHISIDHNFNNNNNNNHKFPATEVLSEFHTIRRDYLKYRNGKKFDYHHHQSDHPSIICKIPPRNNTDIFGYDDGDYDPNNSAILLDNYRRDFARGRSTCSSDSELSTPSVDGMMVQRNQYRCRNISPSPSSQGY